MNPVVEWIQEKKGCSEALKWAEKLSFPSLEKAWELCPNLLWLFWAERFFESPARDRKLRLFACWCVRHTPLKDGRKVWNLLSDKRSRTAVIVAERFARGKETSKELAAASAAAWDAARDAARDAASAAAWDAQLKQFPRMLSNPFQVTRKK